jgi:hypothetical protein
MPATEITFPHPQSQLARERSRFIGQPFLGQSLNRFFGDLHHCSLAQESRKIKLSHYPALWLKADG